jgi:hypothetical protein
MPNQHKLEHSREIPKTKLGCMAQMENTTENQTGNQNKKINSTTRKLDK